MKKYLITLIVLVLVLVAGYFYWQQNRLLVMPNQVACTMEAKICPDGVTYVGRQGPKCEFEKCPDSIQSEQTDETDQTDSSAVATCKGGDQVKCHPGTSTDNFTYINQDNPANWPTYKNEKLGVSIKYPGTSNFGNGAPCLYVAGEDNSYRPVSGLVPIKIFEDGKNVYIANEYFYRLTGEKKIDTSSGSLYKFSGCNKEQNSILELQRGRSIYAQGWEIKTRKVYGNSELEQFIKDNYGSSCKLGERTPSSQNGVYSIKIEGDGLDLGETKCPVNYVYRILYFPVGDLVAAWNLGQSCSFGLSDNSCLDGEISASFKFLTK